MGQDDHQSAIAEPQRPILRRRSAIMQYPYLLSRRKMNATLVKDIVTMGQVPMTQELKSSLVLYPARAQRESGHRDEIDVANPCRQLLKPIIPGVHCLSTRPDEVVHKDNRIILSQPSSKNLARSDEERIELALIQPVSQTKAMKHCVPTLPRPARKCYKCKLSTAPRLEAMPSSKTLYQRTECRVNLFNGHELYNIQHACRDISISRVELLYPFNKPSICHSEPIPLKPTAPLLTPPIVDRGVCWAWGSQGRSLRSA